MQGTDLGSAMISLVRDLDPALMGLISVCCYLLGLAAFIQGCARLLRLSRTASTDPLPQAPRSASWSAWS